MMKPYKSFKDQVQYIIDNKKVQIESSQLAESVFKLFNYTNIINPYKVYFYKQVDDENNHIYIDDTDFQKYLDYYKQDKEISKFLQSICYEFETFFTTSLIHVLSKRMSSNPNYLIERESNIKRNLQDYIKESIEFNKQEKQQAFNQIDDNLMLNSYGLIPNKYYIPYRSWTTFLKSSKNIKTFNVYTSIFSLSLGEKTALYNIMTNKDKKNVIKICSIPGVEDTTKMWSYLKVLRKARNSVSHFENLTIVIDRQFKEYVEDELKKGSKVENIQEYDLKSNYIFSLLNFAEKYFDKIEFELIAELLCMDKSKIQCYKEILQNNFKIRSNKMLTYSCKYFIMDDIHKD